MVVNARHTYRACVGGFGRGSVLVWRLHAPLLPPRQMLKNGAGLMRGAPPILGRGARAVWGVGGGGVDVKGVWGSTNRRGPVVPKGTLRAPVSPFQTTVWCYNWTQGVFFLCGEGGGSDKEEGEVEGEEERR